MKAERITRLVFCLFFTAIATCTKAQDPPANTQGINEAGISDTLKSFWKTNELIIGVSVVAIMLLIVFFIRRKKKKGIDSVL